MKLSDYQKLADCSFVWPYTGGSIYRYWSSEERAARHNIKDVEADLMRQFDCKFDYNNCVILFPLAMGYGDSLLFNNREIVIDHYIYVLDIAHFLKSKGVVWKDGSDFVVDQCFPTTPALVIHKGRATIMPNANPLSFKKQVGTKEIFFSGFLVNRIRNNKI